MSLCSYEGPFYVVNHFDKFFILYMNVRMDIVSIDRLKPVFREVDLGVGDGGMMASTRQLIQPLHLH